MSGNVHMGDILLNLHFTKMHKKLRCTKRFQYMCKTGNDNVFV